MEDNEITRRLRAAGEQPVPETTRTEHLHRIAMTTADAPRRFGRLAVAGAAAVGFFAGSTGLAMAGALPDPAQDVAHDVLAVVQVDVPEGTRGACVSSAAKDPALDAAGKKAAKEACRQQAPPGHGRTGGTPGQQKADKHADDPCRGKPPWVGTPAKTPEARAEREAQREQFRQQRDACPDTDSADAQAEAEERRREEQEDAEERRREAAEAPEQDQEQEQESEQQLTPEAQPEATPVPPVEPGADQQEVPNDGAGVEDEVPPADGEDAPVTEEG